MKGWPIRLSVGNLPDSFTDEKLRSTFEPFGTVESARVISDRDTGRSKGFGLVEMPDPQALEAKSALDGKDPGKRDLRLDEARPKAGGGGGGGGRW